MQQYEVIISEKARTLLGAHIKYMAKISPHAARKTKSQLLSSIKSLSLMPERFPFFDSDFIPRNKYRKMFVESWYLVLYQIKNHSVYVEYILDCRQDYNWLVR